MVLFDLLHMEPDPERCSSVPSSVLEISSLHSRAGSVCERIGGGSGQQKTNGGKTTLTIWFTVAQKEHFNLIESF